MPLYLGIDSSTQSLTGVVIEVDAKARRVVAEASLNFDQDLPHHGAKNGVLPNADPRVAHSPPLLWAEALDLLFPRLKAQGVPLSKIHAIAGSGQQHGSVYLVKGTEEALRRLDPARPLVEGLRGLFSRETSPIWMDSSTARECREIEKALGGAQALAQLTGSRAFERFTGPQIRKFHRESPEAYERTERIHLVSSFLATLLVGKHAPIDPGDGAGMNLMDLRRKRWSSEALRATAPGLEAKLPPIQESFEILGPVASFWVKRHGLSAETLVALSTGDNPSSLIGVGLVKSGRIAISLGTSDTLFGFMPEPIVDRDGEGHVFGAPTGRYMSLLCFKNGSLARERVRATYGMSWPQFDAALQSTPPGNRGAVMLPWFDPEITPRVLDPKVHRFDLDEKDAAANARALIEAQMAAMALHSQWMGVAPTTIYATGGASQNREILKVMADVFQAEVFQFPVGKSAALGAALRALHADARAAGKPLDWDDVVRGFAEPVRESRVAPDPALAALYRDYLDLYRGYEVATLGKGERAATLPQAFRNTYFK